MIMGTSYFVTKLAAIKYYWEYFGPEAPYEVERKIRRGEINIGRPELKPGETLIQIDNGLRYAIIT